MEYLYGKKGGQIVGYQNRAHIGGYRVRRVRRRASGGDVTHAVEGERDLPVGTWAAYKRMLLEFLTENHVVPDEAIEVKYIINNHKKGGPDAKTA